MSRPCKVAALLAVSYLSLFAACSPPVTVEPPECADDDPCAEGLLCRGGACVHCVERSDDAACGEGRLCVGGACIEGDCHDSAGCTTAPDLFCKSNRCAPCAEGEDVLCGVGRLCVAGACILGDCHADDDCPGAGERCVDHRCTPECGVDEDCSDPVRRFCRDRRCLPCRDGVDDVLCGPGSACLDGVCTAGACHQSSDCTVAPNLFCKGNTCSPCADPGDDALCGPGRLCVSGTCREGECRADAQCPRGQVCADNHCGAECDIDEDCPDAVRRFCRSSRCLPCRDGIDDALCGPGSACLQGVCTRGACHRDGDCLEAPRLFCRANTCVPCADPADDAYCGDGKLCLSGVCTRADCREDDDCPRGQLCSANRCSPQCGVDEDCTDPVNAFCRGQRCLPCRDGVDDALCGPGRLCFSGRCVVGTCHLDADCPTDPDRFCHGGTCGPCIERLDDAGCGPGRICVSGECTPGSCHTTADCTGTDVCHGNQCQTCLDRVDNARCPLPGQVCLAGVCTSGACIDSSDCTNPARSRCDPATSTCVATPRPRLPYKVVVTVDAAGKAPLLNPHAWVRIDFGPLLAGLGRPGATVDAASLRVFDDTPGGFGEVPSKVLRTFASRNDLYLWFWARGAITKSGTKPFSLYFTTTDQPGTVATYDLAPPPDAIVASRQGTTAAWRTNAAGRVQLVTGLPATPQGGDNNTLAIADYNNDGFLDLVLCGEPTWDLYYAANLGGADTFQNFAAPTVVARSTPVSNPGCMGSVSGDFNEDGRMDAIVERDSREPEGLVLLLGNGDGTFVKRQLRITSDAPREIDVGDFDGDGHLDLVQGLNGSPTIHMFWGDGTGRFTPAQAVGSFQSDNLDYYANAAGNFSATTAAPGLRLDFIVGGAHYGHDNSARRQFQNNGGRRAFTDRGAWPYVDVCPSGNNVHGFLKALDFDHDGFDDLVGYLYCDGDGYSGAAYHWSRDPSAPWRFRRPVRVGRPSDVMMHGSSVPSLGHNLLYRVTVASAATPGEPCNSSPCGECTTSATCTGGEVCLWSDCGACASNAACAQGRVCLEGACVPCTNRSQCGSGLACLSGACGACTLDADCGTGATCVTGVCTAPPTCKTIRDASPNASLPDGPYLIDPIGAGAYQAWCDMNTAGGGWTLALNLNTRDANTRDFNDTDFWTGPLPVGAVADAQAADFKSKAFTESVGNELLIVAHNNGASTYGTATYQLLPNARGQTLHWMMNNLDDVEITGPRVTGTGGVAGPNSNERTAGDVFIDHEYPVVINSRYSPVDSDNATRLGADYGDMAGVVNFNGHNYGGWGGRHVRAGWGVLYEGAQVNGYCDSYGSYGTNGRGFNGNNPFAGGNCGGNRTIPVDLMVFVR